MSNIPSLLSYHVLSLILDSEIVKYGFIVVLCGETGVCKIAIDMPPLTQATIIEHLQFVGDDEGNDTTTQALFKHDETTYTPITVLERVYLLETDMKIEDVF